MTMRLNLENILKHQMYDVPNDVSRNLALTTPPERAHLRLGAGASPADHYFNRKLNIGDRVNSMISNIHHHMKTTTPPRKAVPSVPAPIAEIPLPPPMKTKSSPVSKTQRIKGGGSAAAPATNKQGVMPIARIKAKLNQQSQRLMRRGIIEMGPKSFTNQRRIREVLLQKTVLENMLLQHKRIQRDRQVIALDIQRMRQDLDKIKTKLDTSLDALNSTKTLYKRKGAQLLPINAENDKLQNSGRSSVKKAKTANVTIKPQLFPKRRRAQSSGRA